MLPFQNLRLQFSSFSADCKKMPDPQKSKSLKQLAESLKQRGIQVLETNGFDCPPEAMMHDRGAVVPTYVISPQSEWGVSQTLKMLNHFQLYDQLPISIKSGGHGYHNGASCSGIMINLARMSERHISDNILILQPGCVLGQIALTLASQRKAVPHGDCFGVGAGGHFTTAGWDLLLARRYGLGCQSVIGGRITLWDGSVVDVNERSHPDLLLAMRGGAAARVGVVTQVRLRLIDEPPRATWRFTPINKSQLEICVANNAFRRAATLPDDISVSFRVYFERDQLEPICSFNIMSLLTVSETIGHLRQHLGDEVTSLVDDCAAWNEKTLLDLRLVPASDFLTANPKMLAEISPDALAESPLLYWKEDSSLREMARSFFTSVSYWVVPNCEAMLLRLYELFQSARLEPARQRMYALIVHGGGRVSELQEICSMPLGQTLARFEVHWDNLEEAHWCNDFTRQVSKVMRSKEDGCVARPYRGDIWRSEQGDDPRLDRIFRQYDRRGC